MDAAHPSYAQCGVQALALIDLISTADVISLHVPLVDSTRGLIDAARIAAMKRGAVLINTARGGIVDEAAVARALKSGHLGGAALDVFETEPLAAGGVFDGCPNLLLTPHVVLNEADADRIKQAEMARMSWCLGDVIKLDGNKGLRTRYDDWGDSETVTVYPEMNPDGTVKAPPKSGTEELPAPTLAPPAQPPTPPQQPPTPPMSQRQPTPARRQG